MKFTVVATSLLAGVLASSPHPLLGQEPTPVASPESVPAIAEHPGAVPRVRQADAVTSIAASEEQQGGVRRPRGEGGAQGRGAGRPPDSGRNYPVDRAVPRSSVPRSSRPVYIYRSSPWPWYYDPWGFYPGFYGGFGVGYSYYAPWAWYGPGPYYYGGPYGPAYGWNIGSVKLKIAPRDAEVFVDGYYAGVIDDFDGTFQSLKLDTGNHRIEVRKPGYEPLTYDVRVQPDRTVTFRGEMRQMP